MKPTVTVAPTPQQPTPPGGAIDRLLNLFQPAPPLPVTVTDPAEMKRTFRYWQKRVLVSSIIGYATFYFVRKNIGVAMPAMEQELGIGKSQLGMFLTLHGLLYGISKFANGMLGDHANARIFMAAGLVVSAILNIFFGLSTAVVAFGLFWMINGWFQGMGFPPCARVLTHWFSPKQLVMNFQIWNISHTIGGGLIVILCGYLVVYDWRLCFFVPAGIGLLGALLIWKRLPDTPPSVGLPEIAETRSSKAGDRGEFRATFMEFVLKNPYIWLLALANFFVYTIRYAVLDWGPSLLTQAKHVTITHAGWMVASFEIAGIAGTLLAGWLANRFFGGRCIRVCVIYMALTFVSLLLFWQYTGTSRLWSTLLLGAVGFFIYGPQSLVGTAAANLATKRAAATAIGLTGLFGYASTVLSGWGLGTLVQARGWDAGFAGLLVSAAAGTLLFLIAWGAKAHSYDEKAAAKP